jgi:hypothetical protein
MSSASSAIKNISLIGNTTNYQIPSPTVKIKKQITTKKNEFKRKDKVPQLSSKTNGFTYITREQSLIVSPKLITSFISTLLEKNANSKYGMDTTNLGVSIPLLLTKLLRPFKEHLLGVKVICSGR